MDHTATPSFTKANSNAEKSEIDENLRAEPPVLQRARFIENRDVLCSR